MSSQLKDESNTDEQNKSDALFSQEDDEFNTNQQSYNTNSNQEYSPNDNSNRKRKHDDDKSRSTENRNKNRRSSNASNSKQENVEVHVKILIPQSSAGRVIGRGGERVVQIQKDSQAKVKMSKSNELHPQSGERVCLIVGVIKNALKAIEMVSNRLETSEKTNNPLDDDRLVQIKMLIPDNTAGLLIGKGGSYIKTIKDNSGAQIQISKHNNEQIERVVTIDGSEEKRYRALRLIVEKISEDPQHSCHSGLVYTPVNNNGLNNSYNDNYNQRDCSFNSGSGSSTRLEILESLIEKSGGSYNMTAASLNDSLLALGFGNQNAQEIINAISVLMRYGLIPKTPPSTNNNINSLNLLASIMSMTGGSNSNLSNYNNSDNNKNNRGSNYNYNNQNSSFNNVLQQVLSNTNQNGKQNRY